jgi:hypothetical protein
MDNFDSEKYQYLKNRIENNKGEKQFYDLLRNFYHSCIFDKRIGHEKKDLLEEYINFNQLIIDRFCKKTKRDFEERKALQYINGYLYLFKGEIFTSLEIFRDLGIFEDVKLMRMLPIFYEVNTDIRGWKIVRIETDKPVSSTFIVFKNLYLLFQALSFNDGIVFLD